MGSSDHEDVYAIATRNRLLAADVAWSHGEGDLVRGPAEALALGIAGRPAAYPDLVGAGVDVLRSRDR
jgi:hypothetical protein